MIYFNRAILITCFLLVIAFQQGLASRSMYVDNFATILGDTVAENTLLAYAQLHDIDALILYELHIVNANHDLANPSTNFILADFISKAKVTYGITNITATAENSDFFTNVIDAYNNSRSLSSEKFDIYNLEFEFWSVAATGPGGYYCTTYLTPSGLPCSVSGAFQFYITILDTMNILATNNSHPITTEAYVGWTDEGQADTIGGKVDRLLLHAYVSNPNTAFSYTEARLIDFANANPGLDVSILYSTEPSFMQSWLENNAMVDAESIFTSDWTTGSSGWANNINLEGFTYYVYSHMTNIILPIELQSFIGAQLNGEIELVWMVNESLELDYFEIEKRNRIGNFLPIGRVYQEDGNSSDRKYSFIDKIPFANENYYRLRSVYIDETSDVSDIINIPFQKSSGFEVFPSLVTDMVHMRSTEDINHVRIYNVQGDVLLNNPIEPTNTKELSLLDFPDGTYYIELKSKSNFETFKIIKTQ